MALPTLTGTGFLISDGVELKYGQSGNAYARLPIVFKNRKRQEDGTWTSDKEVLVECMVFGALAEFLSQEISGRQDVTVSGTLHSEEYTTKAGEKRTSLRLMVDSAAPAGRSPSSSKVVAAPVDDSVPF